MVGEKDNIGAHVEGSQEKRTMLGRILLLGAGGEMRGACARAKTTCDNGAAMRAATLMVSDTGNSLGEEGAVWEEALRQV